MAKSKRTIHGPKSDGRNNRGRYFHTFVRYRRCAQCWGPVEVQEVDGREQLVCPNGCEPGGHVSLEHVNIQMGKDRHEAEQVAKVYPDLIPDDVIDDPFESPYAGMTEEEKATARREEWEKARAEDKRSNHGQGIPSET